MRPIRILFRLRCDLCGYAGHGRSFHATGRCLVNLDSPAPLELGPDGSELCEDCAYRAGVLLGKNRRRYRFRHPWRAMRVWLSSKPVGHGPRHYLVTGTAPAVREHPSDQPIG